MDVSVIVLTWNSQADVERCLSSVFQEIRDIAAEVIVVDNASHDHTISFIETNFPSVILIRNKKNRGVAPARNQGLKLAKGKYALILDIDTEMTPGSLIGLFNFMEKHTDVGLCGPKLLSPDGSLQYSCRKFPTLQYKVIRRLPFKWSKQLLDEEELRSWTHKDIIPVDYVIGACQLIRHKALATVGFLDE
jgi:GT2 family glycosyltransferase